MRGGLSPTPKNLMNVCSWDNHDRYIVGEKDVYRGLSSYSDVLTNGKIVLNTKEIPSTTSVEELIAEGNLKTDLQFTLKQILNQEVIGKYKDKLTFTVEITTA